ncbi:MAG: tetratricopeptide repeat protein [Pyrinomonadaceae bacterium]
MSPHIGGMAQTGEIDSARGLAQLGQNDPEKLKREVRRDMRSISISISIGLGFEAQPSDTGRSGREELVTIDFPDGPVTRDRSKFTPIQEAHYQASQYMKQEDWPNAVAAFQKVIDLKPDPMMLQGEFIMMGMAYHYAGDMEQAAHAFEEAIGIGQHNDMAHLFLGTTRMLAGDYQNAIDPLKKALELNPHDSHANFYLGYVYSELGQTNEAIAAYNAEIAEHREFTQAYEQLGKLYFKLGEENPTERGQYYLKVIATYKKWLKVEPENPSVRNLIGYLYTQIGNLPEAIKGFKEAVKAKPDNIIALSNWGVAYLNAERTSEAREIFKRLASFGEDVVREQLSQISSKNIDEEVRLAMAETYQLLGAATLKLYQSQAQAGGEDAANRSLLVEAESAFKTALSYNPLDAHSVYNLGLVYWGLRRRVAAARQFIKVLELDPNYPDAAKGLKTVQDELEQWRRWMEVTLGKFAASSTDENPLHTEDLVEKLAECRAKLYEGVDPAQEDEAFTEEDLLNAMLPVGEWLSEVSSDLVRVEFARRIHELGWLSSSNAAKLAGLDLQQYVNESGQVDIDSAIKVFKRVLAIDPDNEPARKALEALVEEKLKQRLLEMGLLKEIKEPITDFTPYQNRTPIVVQGKPVSETILEDRG